MDLKEILTSENVVKAIIDNYDYLTAIIPEIKYMSGFDHMNKNHFLDVWSHTLFALSLSENNYDVRLSLLLHDIGKPFCYIKRDNIRYYFGHPLVSANIAKNILIRLDHDEIDKIWYLIKHHDSIITSKLINNDYELATLLYEIQRCDILAHEPKYIYPKIKYLQKVKMKMNNVSRGT